MVKNKIVNQKLEYFIKWKDYDETKNIWEFFQNLIHCKIILKEYYRKEKEEQCQDWKCLE